MPSNLVWAFFLNQNLTLDSKMDLRPKNNMTNVNKQTKKMKKIPKFWAWIFGNLQFVWSIQKIKHTFLNFTLKKSPSFHINNSGPEIDSFPRTKILKTKLKSLILARINYLLIWYNNEIHFIARICFWFERESISKLHV